MSDKIFNFLPPNNNDQISKIKGQDLQELLWLLNHFYLEYQPKLNLPETVTFGLELEYERADNQELINKFDKMFNPEDVVNNWHIVGDSSLENGGEIVSPILKDEVTTWQDLNDICLLLNEYAEIGENTGGHIHIGAQVIGRKTESLLIFLKLWATYENIIFRFSYGEYSNPRFGIVRYAQPLSEKIFSDLKRIKKNNIKFIKDVLDEIVRGKYYAVNFLNVTRSNIEAFHKNNTIEFRCPNGSFNSIVWQNNVRLFVNLLLASQKEIDEDIIDKRIKQNSNKFFDLYYYEEVFLQQSLEFCDLVFTNNLDKLYFLRQYLKSFEVNHGKSLHKSINFTKNKY